MIPLARAVLLRAVDYAGLFPPAGLSMASAVANYRAHHAGATRWALGRFVCPAARLEEFEAELRPLDRGWQLALTCAPDGVGPALAAISAFNQSRAGSAQATALEAPFCALKVLAAVPAAGLDLYCELDPSAQDFEAQARQLKAIAVRAKLRTGGVTAAAIPSLALVLRFFEVSHRLQLPFKATAGLHHPVRGCHRLSYESGAAQAAMHGYLNLTLAAAVLQRGEPLAAAQRMLECEEAAGLRLQDFHPDEIEAGRRLFVGFGSCSFEEPLQWLTSLSPIPARP
ncbi:MAG: hypothetical protein ACRD2D_09950 [Terriglobales bacterium]